MLLVFIITGKLSNNGTVAIKTSRTYGSKEAVLKKFLEKNSEGETEVEVFKLNAYKSIIEGSEILAVNRHAGNCTTLEILHSDLVYEI